MGRASFALRRYCEHSTSLLLKVHVPAQVDSSMTGTYTCEATNEEGSASTSCRMTVSAKPSFRDQLKDTVVVPDGELVLKVKAAGSPKPEVTWKKDGQPITVDGARITTTCDDGSLVNLWLHMFTQLTNFDALQTYTLKITGATAADVGEYTATAKNALGECSTSAKVGLAVKPKITSGLKDINATVDQADITLSVTTEASALKPNVRWYIDDIEIVELDKRYQLKPEPEANKYSLVSIRIV